MEETMWDVWYTHKGNIQMGPRWMVQYSVLLNVVTNLQVSYKNKMEFLYQINSCQLLKENPTP